MSKRHAVEELKAHIRFCSPIVLSKIKEAENFIFRTDIYYHIPKDRRIELASKCFDDAKKYAQNLYSCAELIENVDGLI